MTRLRSLDLFSGCGGITHAFRDVAHPVAYCEIDPRAQQTLKTLMADGRIPEAPVHGDVCTLDGTSMAGGVDIILGGFPCTGVSVAGRRQGLADPGSRLFHEIVRLASEARPPYLFLENVGAITQVRKQCQKSVLQEVVHELDKIGYDMHWITLSAYQVGSPQRRKRWFCLCHDRTNPESLTKSLEFAEWIRHDWSAIPETRMAPRSPEENAATKMRARLLGNSVVPDVVTLAFRMLWTGGSFDEAIALEGPAVRVLPRVCRPAAVPKGHGLARDGITFHVPIPKGLIERPDLKIVLDPGVMPYNHGYKGTTRIETPITVPLFPTPRYSNAWYPGTTLTDRGCGDLATVVRFAASTPDDQRRGIMDPRFIEWLMGYPPDWTRVAARTSAGETSNSI